MGIAITAPTGNIGSRLVQDLLAANAELTLLLRDQSRLPAEVRERVTIREGQLTDAGYVRAATEGAEALFWLSPPNFAAPDASEYYGALTAAAVGAVRDNRIPHVVQISSGGADHGNAGLVTYSGELERALNETGANVMALRCGFFMENFFAYVPTLKRDGAWYGLNRPELPVPLVATQDIAATAAEKLLHRDWQGQVRLGVNGPEDLTLQEAAQVLTEVIGKPIHYIQVPAEAVLQSLLAMGASESIARNYVLMLQAFEEGAYTEEARTPESTTRTTLAEWARTNLKPLLQ